MNQLALKSHRPAVSLVAHKPPNKPPSQPPSIANFDFDAVPPHDKEAECAVLGSMLTDIRAANVAFEMLDATDFYVTNHGSLFTLMRSVGTDLHVIKDAAKTQNLPFTMRMLTDLMEAPHSTANIEEYCNIVLKWSRARKAREAAIRILTADDHDQAANEAGAQLNQLYIPKTALSPLAEIEKQIEDEINGTRSALILNEFPTLTGSLFLLPGTITLITGEGGTSKSFLCVELAWRLYFSGHPVSMFALESSVLHTRRMLAQLIGDQRITDLPWVKANPNEARDLLNKGKAWLKELEDNKVLQFPTPHEKIDCARLLRWISQECDKGKRVLFIDPLTQMETGEKEFMDVKMFIKSARAIIDAKKNTSLVITTHPRTTGPGAAATPPSLDNSSGVKEMRSVPDYVGWLKSHPSENYGTAQPVPDEWGNPTGSTKFEKYNRTLHWVKTRQSANNQRKIALFLCGGTLRHLERGFVE